jgi:hypothetical protein
MRPDRFEVERQQATAPTSSSSVVSGVSSFFGRKLHREFVSINRIGNHDRPNRLSPGAQHAERALCRNNQRVYAHARVAVKRVAPNSGGRGSVPAGGRGRRARSPALPHPFRALSRGAVPRPCGPHEGAMTSGRVRSRRPAARTAGSRRRRPYFAPGRPYSAHPKRCKVCKVCKVCRPAAAGAGPPGARPSQVRPDSPMPWKSAPRFQSHARGQRP